MMPTELYWLHLLEFVTLTWERKKEAQMIVFTCMIKFHKLYVCIKTGDKFFEVQMAYYYWKKHVCILYGIFWWNQIDQFLGDYSCIIQEEKSIWCLDLTSYLTMQLAHKNNLEEWLSKETTRVYCSSYKVGEKQSSFFAGLEVQWIQGIP